ncbi:MAG TPA: GNAT family N-acetyltransferase [Micropepsaceae bacterium]|nr:GNAT family N-acetyltransferase [Micropepsaceae bacterium]
MIAAIIRDATSDEVDEIARVFLAARLAILDIVPMVHPHHTVPDFIRRLMREGRVVIAIMDQKIGAMMALAPGWIEALYVDPPFWNRGLGTALLAHARHSAEACDGLTLWTFQANMRARRFYERHGFRAVAFTDGAGNEEKTPDVRYAWTPTA